MEKVELKYKNLLAATLLSVLFFSLIPGQALAICEGSILPCGDLDGDGDVEDSEICNLCHVFELFNNILVLVLTCFAPIVAGLLLIVGGFSFFVVGGDPSKVNEAKKIILAVVIGLVIIFMAWVFLNTLLTSLGVATWTGVDPTSVDNPWWKINCSTL